MLKGLLLWIGISGLTVAQFPPERTGVTVLQSKFHENVTISYKEPGICETTPGVKSYSGYVHLPPGFLDDGPDGVAQNYPINTFFWFFEARENAVNAPLAIWLNGGPGGSSLIGLLEENGPCFVGADSKTTYLNQWSWNNEVNILYIDQPTQVGFSYDVLTNITATWDNDRGDFTVEPADFSGGVPPTNMTYYVGTSGSQDPKRTANSTAHAAHAFWHFAQTWFTEFPLHRPADNRISLWAESYGGHYGPGFFQFLQQMNDKISRGDSKEKDAHYLHLDTLGIVDGLIDEVVQHESFISFPYNNTYGIQVFNQSFYEELMYNWTRPGGCKDKVQACKSWMEKNNIQSLKASLSDEERLKSPCDDEADECVKKDWDLYKSRDRGWYDIAHPHEDPFPPHHMAGYLMQESTLAALGVPVNYTSFSAMVEHGFYQTHDIIPGYLDAVGELLDHGVKVHLVYGDRDYACNWVGGEAASLAVPYSRAADFAAAGYAPLLTPRNPDDAVGTDFTGMTRQFGNFSFTRVFQAGHMVPSYAPGASHAIFTRATFDRDIASGLVPVTHDLTTVGPSSSWHIKHAPPELPEPRCYILRPGTCVPEVWETVLNGTAVVRDWFVVDQEASREEPIGEL